MKAPVVRRAPVPKPTREAIEEALAGSGGNISAAAVTLGLHRTQLKRLMERYALTARK